MCWLKLYLQDWKAQILERYWSWFPLPWPSLYINQKCLLCKSCHRKQLWLFLNWPHVYLLLQLFTPKLVWSFQTHTIFILLLKGTQYSYFSLFAPNINREAMWLFQSAMQYLVSLNNIPVTVHSNSFHPRVSVRMKRPL